MSRSTNGRGRTSRSLDGSAIHRAPWWHYFPTLPVFLVAAANLVGVKLREGTKARFGEWVKGVTMVQSRLRSKAGCGEGWGLYFSVLGKPGSTMGLNTPSRAVYREFGPENTPSGI